MQSDRMQYDAGKTLWVLAALASAVSLALVRSADTGLGASGAIVDVVPVGGREVAVVYPDRLELAGADGHARWVAAIPPRSSSATQPPPAVVADDERVYIRGRGEAGPVLAALARGDGAELWRAQPMKDTPDELGLGFDHDRIARVLAGPAIVDAYQYDDGREAWVMLGATSRESGDTLWRAKLGPQSHGPLWIRDEHLVFSAQGALHVFRPGDGAPTGIVEAATPICVFARDMVYTREGAFVLAELDGTPVAHIPVAEALTDVAGPHIELRACGRYGDALVLAAETGERTHVVSLAGPLPEHDGGFELRWRVDLGAVALPPRGRADDVSARFPDRAPLSGALPSFVPLKLERDELAMLDAAKGVVAWHARLPSAGAFAFRAQGGNHLLVDPDSGILASVEGRTGRVQAAVRTTAQVSPHHVGDDRLWLHHDDAWAAMNPNTLQPLPPFEPAWIEPVDPDALAAELGLPPAALAD